MVAAFIRQKKNLAIGLLILIALWSIYSFSWWNKSPIPDTKKTPFMIITQTMNWTRSNETVLKKRGEVKGSSDITVSAQVPWRVQSLVSSLGESVNSQDLVIKLQDTYGTYTYASQRAGLSVENAKNTYEQQLLNIDKQLQDAQLAYEKAQLQSTTAQQDASKQVQKAIYDLTNTSNSEGSSTSLQVQKLEKDLEKASFDYQTKIKTDDQTRANFVATAQNIHNDIVLLMQDILYETDKVLWVTSQNQNLNDAFESSLSATDVSHLYTAKDLFLRLEEAQKQLSEVNESNLTIDTVEEYLNQYASFITPINNLLDSMEKVLIHTTAWYTLPETQLDLLKAQFDGYQTKAQATVASITSQLNTIRSFFATYEEQQASLAKSIDILKDQIKITKKWLQDAEFSSQIWLDRTKIWAESNIQNAEFGLKSADNALDFVQNTKNSNLESIRNSRKQAEIAYAEANNNLAKFSVTAPVQWEISDIFVDEGQDVSPWTPLFRIVSNQQEIDISLLPSEYDLVDIGQEVLIYDDNGAQTTWTLVSKSDIGDTQWNFKAIIQLTNSSLRVGTYVNIHIPIGEKTVWIPINTVRIVDNGIGEIFVRDGNEIQKRIITLWSLLGDQVEVLSELSPTEQLIVSNVERYDPQIHTVVLETEAQKNR